MIARLFVWLQFLLPRYWLTTAVRRLARIKTPAVKDLLIRRFVDFYAVDVSDVALRIPDEYESFNDFFIRQLVPGARPIDSGATSIVAPVDGTLSASGQIDANRLIQAKGLYYGLHDLLATDLDDADRYIDGEFATIYLAPYNYHCVHAPCAGRLTSLRYVPGDLFSVNQATVAKLPHLFARNERLVCSMQTAYGPAVVVFVGALNVGSITTRWSGTLAPRKNGVVEQLPLPPEAERDFAKGEMIGWFNMGSTVILIFPQSMTTGLASLGKERKLRVGEAITQFATDK